MSNRNDERAKRIREFYDKLIAAKEALVAAEQRYERLTNSNTYSGNEMRFDSVEDMLAWQQAELDYRSERKQYRKLVDSRPLDIPLGVWVKHTYTTPDDPRVFTCRIRLVPASPPGAVPHKPVDFEVKPV